jgi:lactate dehydrogenase-like 2-hydroxyacid dehydrogenase
VSKHILIVGTGSVGKRHARNLSDLGCTVSCVDPRRDNSLLSKKPLLLKTFLMEWLWARHRIFT